MASSDPARPRRTVDAVFHAAARANPYPIYAQLREAAPVIKSPMGGWMPAGCRYEQVDRFLRSSAVRTPRGYRDANAPAGPPLFDPNGALTLHRRNWVLVQSGEAHTRLRKLHELHREYAGQVRIVFMHMVMHIDTAMVAHRQVGRADLASRRHRL